MPLTRKDLLLLTPAWLAVAWLISRAQWFWSHWPDLQFGWVLLGLSGYLIWESWQTAPPLAPRLGVSFFAAFLPGVAFLLLFQVYQAAMGISPASLWGLALGVMAVVAANLLIIGGGHWLRHFIVAFGFLLLALPLPSIIHGPLIGGLQQGIATINVELLNLTGVPAQRLGNLIALPNCTVGVDEACSGIRSFQSAVMATLFIGQVSLSGGGVRFLLFGAGVILALLGNLLRSFALSYAASQRGVSAVHDIHDAAGWSILAATVAGTLLVASLLRRLESSQDHETQAKPQK